MARRKQATHAEPLDVAAANDQIRERQRDVSYDTRDFTIKQIVGDFQADEFYIPEYQRKFIWNAKHKNRFIESVILGLPIPFMFFAEIPEDGRLEVVDGAQRVQTLEEFLNNDFRLSNLQKLSKLNGFRFGDLPEAQQRKFGNRALRIVILDDTTTVDLRQEIFDRVNTSGIKAKAAEVRAGALEGPFLEFISRMASDPIFKKLCPLSDNLRKRREDEELVLRFLAYSNQYKDFRHDVEKFLHSYAVEKRYNFPQQEYEDEFQSMLRFVQRWFVHGFAKAADATSTPRVRFEAISVGVALALREQEDLSDPDMSWLDSDEFRKHTTTHASNSGPRLRGRVEYVRDRLLES